MNRQKNISFVSIKEIRLEDFFFLPLAEFFFCRHFFCVICRKRGKESLFPRKKGKKKEKKLLFRKIAGF